MAYNRYIGNTGQVIRVQGTDQSVPAAAAPGAPRPGGLDKVEKRPPSPLSMLGDLSGLLSHLSPDKLETEDILLLIFYLLYRESGDKDFLIMMGAMFLS